MKNRRANAVLFGFDFQRNAAIVLMLENIKDLRSVRLEGNEEDIELTLENGRKILAQAKAMNYAPKFFGVDGMDGILTLEGFDTSLAEGVMLLTPFSADATDEKTVNFVKKYNEKYNETPNQFAADAYDCVYAIYEACQKGKVTSDMTAEEVCDIMIAQFTAMSFDGLTGAGMTWSAKGEVTKSPKGMVIQNGVYVGLD